jgi:hypothetical protein
MNVDLQDAFYLFMFVLFEGIKVRVLYYGIGHGKWGEIRGRRWWWWKLGDGGSYYYMKRKGGKKKKGKTGSKNG